MSEEQKESHSRDLPPSPKKIPVEFVFRKPALPDKDRKRKRSLTAEHAHGGGSTPWKSGIMMDTNLKDKDEGHRRSEANTTTTTTTTTTTKLVRRGKMPNTPEFWADLSLADAAFKSSNINFRKTCLAAMRQREKNNVPRRPRKVFWDYLLEEAQWLRRDFREERVWKMRVASEVAGECREEWEWRVREKGYFEGVVGGDSGGDGRRLGYRRFRTAKGGGFGDSEMAVRLKRDERGGMRGQMLGKRKRDDSDV